MNRLLVVKFLLLLWGAVVPGWALGGGEPVDLLHQAVQASCESPEPGPATMAERLSGATGVEEESLRAAGMVIGWKRRFRLPNDAEIRVEHIAPGGRLRRVAAEYWSPLPGADTRPRLAVVAGGNCTIRLGRRAVYEAGPRRPTAIEHLDPSLSPTGERELLNPPVPAASDPGGVPVALVDAGVNYLLPRINQSLARNQHGEILGYDYWDLDRRPFDANPARSPFFVQRHGTKTASLLLREAPEVRLVPYRYPRADMSRMTDLVRDAAAHDIRIVNISMGSNDPQEWDAFARAARRHPRMLFILSAGNNGRHIDRQPIYPAALALENAITVTSSEPDGEVARGSNWGERSVDLLVPAERLVVTGFDGQQVTASGSSYAAVRITALAARLLAEHPDWGAPDLKAAIFDRVLPNFRGEPLRVSQGFMPRPDKAERLPPLTATEPVTELERHALNVDDLYEQPDSPLIHGHELALTLAYFAGTDWQRRDLLRHARRMAAILAQCRIVISRLDVRKLHGAAVYHYFHDNIAKQLVRRLALPKPTVYAVRDTLQVDPYDAEAIGKSNSATRPALRYTIWMTEDTRDPGIALAHELSHILMDSGEHVHQASNLMRAETSPQNTALTDEQCAAMKRDGAANGLLTPSAGTGGR